MPGTISNGLVPMPITISTLLHGVNARRRFLIKHAGADALHSAFKKKNWAWDRSVAFVFLYHSTDLSRNDIGFNRSTARLQTNLISSCI